MRTGLNSYWSITACCIYNSCLQKLFCLTAFIHSCLTVPLPAQEYITGRGQNSAGKGEGLSVMD